MKNTILNKVSSLAKKSLTLCPPPFAGKAVRGLCTILLLCASMMGWADPIDWGSIAYVSGSSQYKAVISPGVPAPGDGIVNVQANAIYVTFPSADFDFSEMTAAGISYTQGGAGIFFNLSNFATVSEMSVTIGNTYNAVKTMYTLTVHNDNPLVVPSTKAPTPATPSQRVRAVYSQYPFNAGMTMLGWSSAMTKTDVIVDGRTFPSFQFGNYLGLGYGPMNVSMMDNIHLDIWTEHSFNIKFFLISPGTENYYTIELTGGTWNSINIPLSTFTADKTRVTEFKFADASVAGQKIFVDNIYFYANDDLPNPDPSEVEDTNFALRTNGSVVYASTIRGENYPARAIDGDNGTQWESVWDNDPQWMVVDFGQRRIFNTVNIYWGNQWAREFYLETSNNGTDWTEVKHITDNTSDHNNSEQSFQLDANATARYIRFRGIVRANDYGYTIKEFGVLLAGVPVLTSVGLSSNKEIVKIDEFATLTAEPKDQNNQAIAATLSYEVSPVDAGHVSDGKYYPDRYAHATITVTAEAGGVQVTNNVQIWGVTSDNLALNKPSEAGYNPGNQSEINTKANDGDEGTLWVTWQNRPAAEEWWYVDLGALYDITGINVSWGGDFSTNYILQIREETPSADDKADDGAWTTLATVTTASANSSVFSQVTGTGRYVRFHSLSRSSGDCFRLRELQVFGSESATPTKSVSASVNDALMGTATVKQNGDPVTEVETGSTVTFSAVANDGYVFVNWSNGNTNATFNATVDAAMNLTANFRALGNVYCNTMLQSTDRGDGVHTAYFTFKKTETNTYQLIVKSEERLNNFGGADFYINGNNTLYSLRNQGVLSDNDHTLTGTITSTAAPIMASGLTFVTLKDYIQYDEAFFPQLTNIEFDVPCDDNVSVTSITLSQNAANLLVNKTLTLTPTFAPVYATDRALTWETSNSSVATVENGVVTAVAVGDATITAKLTSDNSIFATCNVHVVASLTEATWHGYIIANPPTESNVLITYSVTRDVNQRLTFSLTTDKNMVGFVSFINIGGAEHELEGYGATYTATYTTTDTYEDNVALNCIWDVRGANFRELYDMTYMVGFENKALKTLALSETQDNTSAINALDGKDDVIIALTRTFTEDNLYTLVLPFNVDAAQMAAKLPGKLTKLDGVRKKANDDMYLNFVDVSSMEAGVAYLYTPSRNVTNPVFENVVVDKVIHPSTYTQDGYTATYTGIYDATADVQTTLAGANNYVLGSDQWLYQVSSMPETKAMNAFRGYFTLNFGTNAAPGRRARVVFGDIDDNPMATELEELDNKQLPDKRIENGQLLIIRNGHTYNAQGQLLR